MWRLGVAHTFLHALDLILNVAVGDKNIWPAVVVIVEEETSKAECDQRGPPYFRLWGFVDKQAIAFVVVERHHLIGKVADDDTGMTGAIVIGRVHAHAGPRHAVFTECDAGGDAALFKRSLLLIEIKLVGLRVIGNQNVGPAVAVVVENCDA